MTSTSALLDAMLALESQAMMIGLSGDALKESLSHQLIDDPTDNLILHCILDHSRNSGIEEKALLTEKSQGLRSARGPRRSDWSGDHKVLSIDRRISWTRNSDSLNPEHRLVTILNRMRSQGCLRSRHDGISRGTNSDGRTPQDRLDALEARLTGPKRIALFGHRNVGKTTLLAMFYRQASAGQVPGVRLAAADAASAEYLAEKIAQIESGEPMAGTLAETELKLRLYHGPARFELIVKDYQGEHVTLGSRRADPGVLRRLRRRAALPRPRGLGRPGRAAAAAAGGREPAGTLHRPLRGPQHRPARSPCC